MKTILLVTAALLAFPSTGQAASITPPVGESTAGYTLLATDAWSQLGTRGSNTSLPGDVANGVVRTPSGTLQWGSSGCTSVDLPWGPQFPGNCDVVSGTIATWRATRSHRYRTAPWLDVTLQRFYATATSEVITTTVADQVVVHADLDSPDCTVEGHEGWVVPYGPGPAGLGAAAVAPDDFVVACGLPRATGIPTTNPTGNPPTDDTLTHETLTAESRCGRVGRVAIGARSANCRTARTIMAAWLRRGVEPPGWVCVTARLGRSRAATCARTGRARSGPRVTGRWRA